MKMAGKLKKSKGKKPIKPIKKIKHTKAKAKITKKAGIVAKKTVKSKQAIKATTKIKLKAGAKAKTAKTKNKPASASKINTPVKSNKKKVKSGITKVIDKNMATTSTRSNLAEEKNELNYAIFDSNVNLTTGPGQFQPYTIDSTEDYMNEQQLQHFASILESWKRELMLEVDNTITEMKEADILADPNDRATQEETFNLELRTRDRERKLIKKIESALSKIAEQKYGYCDSCGVEIGIRRLEARPTASLCIECKTLSEIREKRS